MANELERVRTGKQSSLNKPSITKERQLENKINSVPKDRALEPGRSVGSGPSMGPNIKKDLDPGFKGPGSLKPSTPKDNVDPGFGRKTMPAPRNYGGIQAQPMPYYPGQGGGGIKTMPYTPPADGSGPKFENMPYIKPSDKLKPGKPAPQDKLKPAKPSFTPPSKKMQRGKP
jgi:hypothetical protein